MRISDWSSDVCSSDLIDFFVNVLGQRFVKRTLFYDGSIPIYHLYFADELGTPGTVMTTFPTRRTGLKGRKGSNQFTVCTYSIPKGSLEWWIGHLNSHGIATGEAGTRFGQRRSEEHTSELQSLLRSSYTVFC